MKYIDAEKLKAEINRLHTAHSGKYGCDEVGVTLEYLEDLIDSLQQEQPDGIEGVVHHFHMAHYIVTNQEQLTARLRQFPSEAEVKIFIYAIKEDGK